MSYIERWTAGVMDNYRHSPRPVCRYLHNAAITAMIHEAEFDGIKLEEAWSSMERDNKTIAWCVYDPKQLKSALANKGTYKRTHADIGEGLAARIIRLCSR